MCLCPSEGGGAGPGCYQWDVRGKTNISHQLPRHSHGKVWITTIQMTGPTSADIWRCHYNFHDDEYKLWVSDINLTSFTNYFVQFCQLQTGFGLQFNYRPWLTWLTPNWPVAATIIASVSQHFHMLTRNQQCYFGKSVLSFLLLRIPSVYCLLDYALMTVMT